MGEIIGQLHLALAKIEDCVSEADLLSTVRDWAIPKSKEALGLSEDFCRSYQTTFSGLYPRLPRQIIHRDPNPGNIICADDRWGFIDFELAEHSDNDGVDFNFTIVHTLEAGKTYVYAATAGLSETFDGCNEGWLDIYRDILWGYDSAVHLTDAERQAVPYVILANQFVCVAWFAEQEQDLELFETNRRMTKWLIDRFDALGEL